MSSLLLALLVVIFQQAAIAFDNFEFVSWNCCVEGINGRYTAGGVDQVACQLGNARQIVPSGIPSAQSLILCYWEGFSGLFFFYIFNAHLHGTQARRSCVEVVLLNPVPDDYIDVWSTRHRCRFLVQLCLGNVED